MATRGFTLVELLVVVAVMLILIVITVSAIDFAFTSERLRAGARQVQSALEGARDRAIFAKEARGLRLLVDPDDPRIVTSFVYVGASRNWSEGQIRLERLDADGNNVADTEDADGDGVLDPGEDTNGNTILDTQRIVIVRGDATCGWSALKDRGFLGLFEDRNLNGALDPGEDQNGNLLLDLDAPRIKIPADENGTWYTVLTHRLTPTNSVLELITPYRDPGTTPPTEVVAFQGTGPSTYILELPPRILPDAQPILLPENVCVDLDGSLVPDDWRPGPGSGVQVPYSGHMDIMFSQRGVVTGPLAAMGLLHLYVAEIKDVQKSVDVGLTGSTIGPSPPRRPPVNNGDSPLIPGQNQFNPDEPIGDRSLVTIFTQTGKVSSHHIDPTDSDSNGYADNPFAYAQKGIPANQ